MDSLILPTIIATLLIIGLNVFLFREKIHDLLDFRAIWASNFSKSVCFTFCAIVLIFLIGFFVDAFSDPIANAIIFLGIIAGNDSSDIWDGIKKAMVYVFLAWSCCVVFSYHNSAN